MLTLSDASTRSNAEQQLSQAAEGDFVRTHSIYPSLCPAITSDTLYSPATYEHLPKS